MKNQLIQTVVGFGATVMAASAISKQCPMPNSCFSLNIPDASGSSGGGDVFLQITGPTSNSWLAIGTGSQMAGSTMLVIYASGDGNNITLSGRKGDGHNAPVYSPDIKATLLDGSGISNGVMTANIKCSSCGKDQADWIYGAFQGSPLKSDSPTQAIKKHTELYGTFNFDVASAKGGSSTNPFGSPSPASGGSGGSSGGNSAQGSGGNGAQGSSGGAQGGSGGTGAPSGTGVQNNKSNPPKGGTSTSGGPPVVQTGGANGAVTGSYMLSALPMLFSLLSLFYSSYLIPAA